MISTDVIELVKKNFKTLIRSKAGSLIVILGPLLVIFLAGLAFDNSNTYAVKIGAYRPEVDTVTTDFLDGLRDRFEINEYDTEEKCIKEIKNNNINTCMVFDGNFTVGKVGNNQITFHVDYSRINLVWTIMNEMTSEVGERSLNASTDLTQTLLDTLEFTHQTIGEQRKVLVKLTTQNELMLRNSQDLLAELGDLNLEFDDNGFPVQNVTKATTQVKQWVDNALALGEKGLSEATNLMDSSSTAADVSGNENVKKQLKADLDDIKDLRANFAKTKELTQESFEKFKSQLDSLVKGIQNTKTNLQEADTSRELSLRVLESVTNLLDESLLGLLELQQAFNEVDNRINSIEIKDSQAISQPIVTSIKPLVQDKTYLNYLFPVLIVLIIMFTALLITPTLILLEKHSPASFRTYMTPVDDISYILATFITAFILLFLQVIVILAIASVFFSGQVLANAPASIVLLMITNAFFILVGMIVGYLFNSEETATLAAVSVGSVFLFISDVIIPIESMPKVVSFLASLNPYVISSSLLRRSFLFDVSVFSLIGDTVILLGYVIAAGLLAAGTYMLTRRYSLQQAIKKLAPVIMGVVKRKKKK